MAYLIRPSEVWPEKRIDALTIPAQIEPAATRLQRTSGRVVAAVAAAGIAIVAGIFASSPGHAATKTEKTFDAWTVVCVEDDAQAKRCSMLQSRIRAQDKKLALLWTISAGDNNELTQSLTVPAGISIKEGIRLFIGDGDPATFGYDVCGPRVCIARGPFGADLAEALKAADKASASYVVGSKQLMQVQFDLTGFGAAYDFLVSQLS